MPSFLKSFSPFISFWTPVGKYSIWEMLLPTFLLWPLSCFHGDGSLKFSIQSLALKGEGGQLLWLIISLISFIFLYQTCCLFCFLYLTDKTSHLIYKDLNAFKSSLSDTLNSIRKCFFCRLIKITQRTKLLSWSFCILFLQTISYNSIFTVLHLI